MGFFILRKIAFYGGESMSLPQLKLVKLQKRHRFHRLDSQSVRFMSFSKASQ